MSTLAIDVDGVLANFTHEFHDLLARLHGEKKPYVYEEITCWDWHLDVLGYTKEQAKAAWDEIRERPYFWGGLAALPEAKAALLALNRIAVRHQVYFVTSRFPDEAHRITHGWLTYMGAWRPNVMLVGAGEKPAVLEALKADVVIDDKLETCVETQWRLPNARVYLKDAPYNQVVTGGPVERVKDINEMLDREGL